MWTNFKWKQEDNFREGCNIPSYDSLCRSIGVVKSTASLSWRRRSGRALRLPFKHIHTLLSPAVSKAHAGVIPQGREHPSFFFQCKQMSKKHVHIHEHCAQSKPREVSWRKEIEKRNEPTGTGEVQGGSRGQELPLFSCEVVTGLFTTCNKGQIS